MKIDRGTFKKGVNDGLREGLENQGVDLEHYENIGEDYYYGFLDGVEQAKALKEGLDSVLTMRFSTHRWFDFREPWYVEIYAEGIWQAFADNKCVRGFSA